MLLWVGLVAASLAFGPLWRVISPMRTVYRLLGTPRWHSTSRAYPDRWGYRPAAVGLFAFVWLELASPNPGSLLAIKIWLLVYAVAMLGGAVIYGQRWFARADPFEVYSVAVSRLSPLGRNLDTRRIVVGNPLDNLASMPVRPGLVPHRRPAGIHRDRRRHVQHRCSRNRRCRPPAAHSAARADGALHDPDSGGLHLRALSVVSGRAGAADDLEVVGTPRN